MQDILYMAWRYVLYNRLKTIVLVASICLIVFLPAGLNVLVNQSADALTARAESTPLLIGAKGSATDLTLSALYFRPPTLEAISYRELDRVDESGLALPIPLHLRYQAGEFRIVGTSLDYFDFRRLVPAEGRLMAMLGECVLGATVAKRMQAASGSYVFSSPAGAFDVAGSYPLKMKVVGVLAQSGTPDDEAVFVDVKTTWVISGLAHGHMDMSSPEAESGVLRRETGNVVANASVLSYTEITKENINSFHFHGDTAEFPIDAILAVPYDRKSKLLLRGRYLEEGQRVQMLVPEEVMTNLVETVFTVRDYIVIAAVVVGLSTLATTILVFLLSLRLRRREIETIRKIGGTRRRVMAIVCSEILFVLLSSGLLAWGLTLLVSRFSDVLTNILIG